MSVQNTVRDIDALLPVAQTAIKLFFQECHKAGIKIFVTETYRSQERQNYLYAQGRTRLGKVITWTTKSRHTSRLAWDIAAALLDGNKDVYTTSYFLKAGAIAMKLGITWGGQPSWVKAGAADYPHFEVSSNWKIPEGYKIEGVVSIPTKSNEEIKVVKEVKQLPKVELAVKDDGNNIVIDGVTEYAKSIGKNYTNGKNVFRIHTVAFPSKKDADLACVEYVEKKHLRYAEVFGDSKAGYRLQSGKYTTEKDAEDVCKKMLDSNVVKYLSIVGFAK